MVWDFLQSRTGLKISKSHQARQTGCILNIHLSTMGGRFVRQADRFEHVGCGIWCCELVVKTPHAWHTDVAMWKQTLLTPALGKTHVCSCRVWNELCFFFFFLCLAVSCLDCSLIFWDAYIFSRGFLREHMVSIMRPPANTNTHRNFPLLRFSKSNTPSSLSLFSSDPHLLFFTSLLSFRSSLPPSFLILFPPCVLNFLPFNPQIRYWSDTFFLLIKDL